MRVRFGLGRGTVISEMHFEIILLKKLKNKNVGNYAFATVLQEKTLCFHTVSDFIPPRQQLTVGSFSYVITQITQITEFKLKQTKH